MAGGVSSGAHLQGQGFCALRKFQIDRWQRRCGAMLDGKREFVLEAAQVEIGVAPGMELRGPAQGLAGTDVTAALFCVVDDKHSQMMTSLQLA